MTMNEGFTILLKKTFTRNLSVQVKTRK